MTNTKKYMHIMKFSDNTLTQITTTLMSGSLNIPHNTKDHYPENTQIIKNAHTLLGLNRKLVKSPENY